MVGVTIFLGVVAVGFGLSCLIVGLLDDVRQ